MLTVFIATFNEEKHIARSIKSALKISDDLWILDGGSSDNTLEIAKKYNCKIIKSNEHFCDRINTFQKSNKYKYEWLMRLDADEILKIDNPDNLKEKVSSNKIAVIELKRFFKWKKNIVKFGGFQNRYADRIWNSNYAKMDRSLIDEKILIMDKSKSLEKIDSISIIDNPLISFDHWWFKHKVYALNEARNYYNFKNGKVSLSEDKVFYYRLPLVFRVFAYAIYGFIFQKAILDFHCLKLHFYRLFLYRLLIDIRILLKKI